MFTRRAFAQINTLRARPPRLPAFPPAFHAKYTTMPRTAETQGYKVRLPPPTATHRAGALI